MSKELIDRLISYIPNGDGYNSQYANDLADAVVFLKAKAAPLGELRQEFEKKYPAAKTLVFCAGRYDAKTESSQWKHAVCAAINQSWDDYQAGAAYQRAQQRAQQPQSAGQEPVAFYWQDVGYKNPNRHGPYFGRPSEAALRNVDGGAIPVLLYTTPQPSAGVAMPERKTPHFNDNHYAAAWNDCLDEFARLNKGAGLHE